MLYSRDSDPIRRVLRIQQSLIEGKDELVYHASPDPSIQEFHPRPFIHTPDYTESGQWTDKSKSVPEGYKLSNLIFGTTKRGAALYSLPRGTQRISVDPRHHPGAHATVRKMFPALGHESVSDKTIMLLPEKDKAAIDKHTWTRYGLDGRQFMFNPASDEYIAPSNKPMRPVSREHLSDPVGHLKHHGFAVQFVPDIEDVYSKLSSAGHSFDTENMG